MHALGLWANSSKCYILCMNRSKVKPAVNYFLDGQPVSLVDSHTYPGITISSELRWQKSHFQYFCMQKHQGSLILLDAMFMDALRRRKQLRTPS